VQINIHELANVPLVTGDYACRWRVKGAQPLHQALSRRDSASGKSVRSDGTGSASGSGSFKDMLKKPQARTGNSLLDADIEVQVQPPSPPMNPIATQASISTTLSLGESGWSSPSESSDGKPSSRALLQPDGTSSHDHGSDTEDGNPRATPSSATLTNDRSHAHLHGLLGPGRGRTTTVAIVDHTVRWDELVELAVNMGVIKESKGLMPADLKLTVEQVGIYNACLS
jgi:hypothetical protein